MSAPQPWALAEDIKGFVVFHLLRAIKFISWGNIPTALGLKGRYPEALAALDSLPQNEEVLLPRAMVHSLLGEYAKAESLLLPLKEEGQADPQWQFLLGYCHLKQGLPAQAAPSLKGRRKGTSKMKIGWGFLAKRPSLRTSALGSPASWHYYLAFALHNGGRNVEAVESVQKALALEPDEVSFTDLLSASYYDAKQYEDVLRLGDSLPEELQNYDIRGRVA